MNSTKCFIIIVRMLQVDYGRGTKPAGYYVQYPSGLFPAPLPQNDYDRMADIETLFHCIGTLFAKCIQDGRLVDIPLSRPLLKLMCGGDMTDAVAHTRSCASCVCVSRSSDDDLTPTEPMNSPPMNPWYDFTENALRCFCPAIRSIGRDTKFTVHFCLCTFTDLSFGALLIGMKFCVAVWPDLGQVFCYFGG